MFNFASLLVVSSAATLALGHAVITSPAPRAPGPAALAACGQKAYTTLSSDLTAPIEYVDKTDPAFNAAACPVAFCRGLSFSDNTANVQSYTPGQVIPINVNIRVRHGGYANVSIVDTASESIIGTPLLKWPVYASTGIPASQYPANETAFSITLPELPALCGTAGACAIQWWWLGANAQTYMSCVDFTTPKVIFPLA